MNKLLLLSISAVMLTACSEEKNQFRQTVLEQMQTDKDIKDYHIDPAVMADCVTDLTSGHMPGIFPFDPRRKAAYKGYSKMLALQKSEDPKALLQELQTIFGSGKAVADAHQNYSESVMECIQSFVGKAEKELDSEETPEDQQISGTAQ